MGEQASEKTELRVPGNKSKVVILTLAIAYVVGTALYLSPPSLVAETINTPLVSFWHYFGWSQGWSVFAPNLRRYNPHATATVTFADGSTQLYEFPRMEKMSLLEKWKREKWRKFDVDNMPWSSASGYHEDVARFVARELYRDSANPPVQVALAVHWAGVPELPQMVPSDKFPEHNRVASFFIYRVRKKDLQHD